MNPSKCSKWVSQACSKWVSQACWTLLTCISNFPAVYIAHAQQGENSKAAVSSERIETILVSAQRTPTNQSPVEPWLLNTSNLQHRGSPWVSDILQGLPGVHVSHAGAQGSLTQVRVRGAEANQLLVLVDGIELNDPALGSEVNFGNLMLTGVTRMEFLPGPQSALWGSDALAGVLALSTIPTPDTAASRISIGTGSHSTRDYGFSTAKSRSNFYYSVNGEHRFSQGVNTALIGKERDGYRNTTYHISTGYTGSLGKISTSLRSVRAESEFDPTPFPAFLPRDGNLELVSDQLLGNLRIDLAGLDQRWHHAFSYSFLNTDNDTFNNGDVTDGVSARKFNLSYQTDLSITSESLDQVISLALEYEREQFSQHGTPTLFGDPNQDQKLNSTGWIGDYHVVWQDKLFFSLSTRYDSNRAFASVWSYRTALSYLWQDTQTKLFLNAGKGIKNPTFTERFGFTPNTFIGNSNLVPEHSNDYSFGINQLIGSYQTLRATYFRGILEDEINGFAFDPAIGAFTAINQTGTSKRQGIEVSVAGSLLDILNYRTGYTWLDATQPGNNERVREVRRPKNSAFLEADIEFMEGQAHIQVGVLYTGGQKDLNFATFPATTEHLPAYSLVHLAASYSLTRAIKISGRIENLFNETYQEVFGYRSPPRQLELNLELTLAP